MLLRIIEFIGVVFLLYLVCTQIVLPAIRGRRLFPAFRRTPEAVKAEEMRDEVGELQEQVEQLSQVRGLSKRRDALKKQLDPAAADPAEPNHPH